MFSEYGDRPKIRLSKFWHHLLGKLILQCYCGFNSHICILYMMLTAGAAVLHMNVLGDLDVFGPLTLASAYVHM